MKTDYEAVVRELRIYLRDELNLFPYYMALVGQEIKRLEQKHTLPDSQEKHCCGCALGIEVDDKGEHVWVDGEYIAREYVPCTKRADKDQAAGL